MSTFYTACAKCGDEIGSAHKILWLAGKPWHPECATERDRMGERDKVAQELALWALRHARAIREDQKPKAFLRDVENKARELLSLYGVH